MLGYERLCLRRLREALLAVVFVAFAVIATWPKFALENFCVQAYRLRLKYTSVMAVYLHPRKKRATVMIVHGQMVRPFPTH